LDRLDAATKAEDMHLAGFKFQGLSGERKGTFAVSTKKSRCWSDSGFMDFYGKLYKLQFTWKFIIIQ